MVTRDDKWERYYGIQTICCGYKSCLHSFLFPAFVIPTKEGSETVSSACLGYMFPLPDGGWVLHHIYKDALFLSY
jgi:hypothetical protein